MRGLISHGLVISSTQMMFLEAESFYICLFLLPACVRWMQMSWDELVWMTWKTLGDLNWQQLFCEELCRWKWVWKQHVFPPMIATLVVGSWLKHWNLSCNSSWQIWQLFSGLLQVTTFELLVFHVVWKWENLLNSFIGCSLTFTEPGSASDLPLLFALRILTFRLVIQLTKY